MRLVFDLEADGLLDDASRVHCLALRDIDGGELQQFFHDNMGDALQLLSNADLIIGHNIIGYDLPVLQKLYPSFVYDKDRVRDTMILSRLVFADLSDTDAASGRVQGEDVGSHSLRAWGRRLGVHKGEYDGGWATASQEMFDYNRQDVVVTERLWNALQAENVSEMASELEHRVAFIVAKQERHGVAFDVKGAERLTLTLMKRRAELVSELQDTFKPFYTPDGVVTPKRTTNGNKNPGTWEGCPYTKIKLTTFNPNSRHHIANRLMRLRGWKPEAFTEGGQPKVDETVLEKLPWSEAKLLHEFFLVQKRLAMIAEGDQAWLKLERKGRIYGSVITNGAVTGRATHRSPNLSQVPSNDSLYGKECRELFGPSAGRVMVGTDVEGLELRCLAHFMARYDGGDYGRILLEGDIHTYNQQLLGLPTRSNAKTFIYAVIYGAGDEKLGKISGGGRNKGASQRAKLAEGLPALNALGTDVQRSAKRGYLLGLDKRRIRVRSAHSAFNTLLQSCGALICKRWMVEVDDEITRRGWQDKCQQVLWSHDELQFEVDPDIADEFGKACVECIQRAGDYFKIRIRLDGKYSIGKNWKETH